MTTSWPTARHFAEAVQCPSLCFNESQLKDTLPAIDRLGMPLVTSGQFAYVFKLKSKDDSAALAVRCFRSYLGDREQRYEAIDAHLSLHTIPALPRFRYLPKAILIGGQRYPVLVMEWIEGPTLDVYLDEVMGRSEVLWHLADEWVKLISVLREAEIAHGDLQHGNIIIERGQIRLVDLDGMFVPAMSGLKASEVGHQHYQHPARRADLFNADIDNFSALVIYLSLISLAERPSLWTEHHDENLLFTRADFVDPASSKLLSKIKSISPEHASLAEVLESAIAADPSATPSLLEFVNAKSKLPAWMTAPLDIEVSGRTREVARQDNPQTAYETGADWRSTQARNVPATPGSTSVQSIFSPLPTVQAVPSPSTVGSMTLKYARETFFNTYSIFWIIPAFNLLKGFWTLVGFTDAAWMLAMLSFIVLFLAAGFVRAITDANTATTLTQSPAGSAHLPPPSNTSYRLPVAHVPRRPISTNVSHAPTTVGAGVHVIGNQSLRIYHLPDCEWVDRILPQQRLDFASDIAAQIAGYHACKICLP